jgi:hypothetical protein
MNPKRTARITVRTARDAGGNCPAASWHVAAAEVSGINIIDPPTTNPRLHQLRVERIRSDSSMRKRRYIVARDYFASSGVAIEHGECHALVSSRVACDAASWHASSSGAL